MTAPSVPLVRALAAWLGAVDAVPPREVPLAQARGRVVAEPLVARRSVPARPEALRAGFAIRASDSLGATGYAPALRMSAPSPVSAGEPLPEGTDAVLPADALTHLANGAEIHAEVPPGSDVRPAGFDVRAGEVLRPAGWTLRDVDVLVAEAAGLTSCAVRIPTVLLRGAEAGSALEAWLAGLVKRLGGDVTGTEEPAQAVIHVLSPGDPGEGPRLALRPGETTRLLLDGGRPFLGVGPGLDAVMGAALACLPPLLARLAGAEPAPAPLTGRLTAKIASRIGLAEIALVRSVPDGIEPLAIGDLPHAAWASADGWLLVPAQAEGYATGETVRAFAL